MKEKEKGGVGVQSLMMDYVQQCAATLTLAFNDKGVLGVSTRAIWKAERTCFGNWMSTAVGENDHAFANITRNLHITNRLSMLKSAGLEIETPEEGVIQLEESPILKLISNLNTV